MAYLFPPIAWCLNIPASQSTFVHVDAGARAVWNQVLDFDVPSEGIDPSLDIAVLDKETIGKDKVIGVAKVPLTPLFRQTGGRVYWLNLEAVSGSGGKGPGTAVTGELRLGIQYTPYVVAAP